MKLKYSILLGCLIFAGCSEKEEEEVSDPSFAGEGASSTWGNYQGQTATLLDGLLLEQADFDVSEDDNYYEYTAEFLEQYFNYQKSNYKADSSGGISISSLTGLDYVTGYYDSESQEYYRADDDCLQDLLKDVKIQTLGSEYRFDVSIDVTACYLDGIPSTYTGHSVKIEGSFYGQCYGKDLSTLNELTYKEISDDEYYKSAAFCGPHSSEASAIIVTESYIENEITYTNLQKYATLDANGRSCQRFLVEDVVEYENDCTEYSLLERTSRAEGATATTYKYFMSQTTKDLKREYSGEHDYYKSGSMEIHFYGWDGTITYDGADEFPTWTLSKDDEEVTGTFSDD